MTNTAYEPNKSIQYCTTGQTTGDISVRVAMLDTYRPDPSTSIQYKYSEADGEVALIYTNEDTVFINVDVEKMRDREIRREIQKMLGG